MERDVRVCAYFIGLLGGFEKLVSCAWIYSSTSENRSCLSSGLTKERVPSACARTASAFLSGQVNIRTKVSATGP